MISRVVGVRFIIWAAARSDDNVWVSLPQLSHCLGAQIPQIPLPPSEQGTVWGIPPLQLPHAPLTTSPLPPALGTGCHRGELGLCNDNFVRGEKVSHLVFVLMGRKAVTQQCHSLLWCGS